MKLPTHGPTLGRKSKTAVGLLAALALLIALFDWNWFRPALERHLTHTSQRSVQLADLHLGLDASLDPVVQLRGVQVQNAPWADDPRPFAVAQEVRFTFDWQSLFSDVKEVKRLVLIGADIDLERRADGLRNWRLTRPDDRGPPRLRVLLLEAHDSRLRVVHEASGLVLQTAADTLPQPDGAFTQRIRFDGRLNGAPFAGDTLTGPVLSLQRTGEFFPLRGEAHAGATRLRVDGRAADLMKLGGLDAEVRLNGPSLAQIEPFFPALNWPASAPYRAQAHVEKHGLRIDAQALQVTLGDSDLAGELSYDKPDDRPSLTAKLRSRRVTLADLPWKAGAGKSLAAPAGKSLAAPAGDSRVLPRTALPLDGLRALEATLEWKIGTLQAPALPAVQALRTRATLSKGLLQVAVLDSELAAGHLAGRFTLDGRAEQPAVRLELRARGLRVEQLWPAMAQVEGPLDGDALLTGQGRSVAAWAGSAQGKLSLALKEGRLNNRLDAKLGLDGGKFLRSFFSERQVPLHCGALAIDFDKGIGTTRQLVLDSERTHVEGQGSLHLRDEAWAVLLTPQARGPALLALDSSVRVQGSFRDFSYQLVGSRNTGAGGATRPTAAQALVATSPSCSPS